MGDPQSKRRGGWLVPLSVIALLLLGAYVGAYLLLLRRELHVRRGYKIGNVIQESVDIYRARFSENEIVNDALVLLFKPLHALDRKCRPHFWTEDTTGVFSEFRARDTSQPIQVYRRTCFANCILPENYMSLTWRHDTKTPVWSSPQVMRPGWPPQRRKGFDRNEKRFSNVAFAADVASSVIWRTTHFRDQKSDINDIYFLLEQGTV